MDDSYLLSLVCFSFEETGVFAFGWHHCGLEKRINGRRLRKCTTPLASRLKIQVIVLSPLISYLQRPLQFFGVVYAEDSCSIAMQVVEFST